MTRSLSILGATGSIGASTLDLVRRAADEWRIEALTAHQNVPELARLAREFGAKIAVISDETLLPDLKAALEGSNTEAAGGVQALMDAAARPTDLTMAAIVGCAGLAPTMTALERGGTVALANKEALVSAGEIMLAAARTSGAQILPVDSEHNAIFQCLAGNTLKEVRKITLTASGGPFLGLSAAQLRYVTPAQAVRHPNWSMGQKISVDSATMMNKGLELIEAHYLFPVGLEKLGIIIHPQSVVHSMVEYRDGSTLAQLGPSDMRVPIASCLAYPDRMDTPCEPLDLAALGALTFIAPDEVAFPASRIARDAILAGGAAPCVLNAANEIAVAAFLDGRIGFLRITTLVEDVLNRYDAARAPQCLDDVFAIDEEIRQLTTSLLEVE